MLSNMPAESLQNNEKYRWYILALITAIGTFVASIQQSCLPVLFKEISDDLSLNIVQVGTIWGISNLAGIFISIIAGLLSDRFGVKLVLSVICVMSGITGALRGISNNYPILVTTVFINGIFRMIIPVSVTKAIGIWFKGKNLGLAIGISTMGDSTVELIIGPSVNPKPTPIVDIPIAIPRFLPLNQIPIALVAVTGIIILKRPLISTVVASTR